MMLSAITPAVVGASVAVGEFGVMTTDVYDLSVIFATASADGFGLDTAPMQSVAKTAPKPKPPTIAAILKELRAAGTPQKRASAVRVGIPMNRAFGVSVGATRAIARRLKGQHALAQPLWASGIHEARLLAILIADPQALSRTDIERWLDDVVSWDLCDHLCGNLVLRRADAASLVQRWITSPKLYVKRAAFALIAELAVHGDDLKDETLDSFAALIARHAGDTRPHVRQAASWALRSIGKRDARNHDRVLLVAADLVESEDGGKRWVGRDATRELESLVKVRERKRLLTSKSKTVRATRRGNQG
jgi:3-methyladenine DNA glycosylase AlkD